MKITSVQAGAKTLSVDDGGVTYEVKIPAFCDTEEKVKSYIVAYVEGKKVEEKAKAVPAEFDLTVLVNQVIGTEEVESTEEI